MLVKIDGELNDKISIIKELEGLRALNTIRARYSLIGLLMVFFLSLVFFLFSSYFTKNQVEVSTEGVDIRKLETAVEEQLTTITNELGLVREKMDIWKSTEFADSSASAQSMPKPKQTEAKLTELYQSLDDRKGRLMKELDTLQIRRLNELELTKETQTLEVVISTSITRIGAVMLAVFMMQILLSFYRYYTRLSSFYGSKLVGARIIDFQDIRSLKEFLESLSIEGIDFGKEPNPPLEKVIQLLRAGK